MASDGPMKLFVGQIPKSATEQELTPFFETYGAVNEFSILRDKAGMSKGMLNDASPLTNQAVRF